MRVMRKQEMKDWSDELLHTCQIYNEYVQCSKHSCMLSSKLQGPGPKANAKACSTPSESEGVLAKTRCLNLTTAQSRNRCCYYWGTILVIVHY